MSLSKLLAALLLLVPVASAQTTTASYPFYDGFEGEVLDSHWVKLGDGFPAWTLTGDFSPFAGDQHLQLGGETVPGIVVAGVDLHIDLAGRTGVLLDFQSKRLGYSVLLEEGLYLSDDGKAFHEVFAPEPIGLSLEYERHVFDLDQLAKDVGISFTEDFVIRYKWSGFDTEFDDGILLDEFRVLPAGFSTLGVISAVAPTGLGNFGTASTGVGDLNGDGHPDFGVGHPGYSLKRGRVELFDGQTFGSIGFVQKGIFGERMGEAMANVGDLDGDGFDELVVGAPSNDIKATDGGAAYVVSPKLGSVLFDLHGTEAGEGHGTTIASAGDLDGDGKAEFLVASPAANAAGGEDSGRVTLYRGGDFSAWRTFEGASVGQYFGRSLDGGMDLNDDGFGDLLIGSPGWIDGQGKRVGAVQAFSGATGQLLKTYPGVVLDGEAGTSVAWLPDVDGDFVPEVASGAPNAAESFGMATVFSGSTSAVLQSFTGEAVGDHLGASLVMAGDMDGFGLADLVIGSNSTSTGSLLIVSLPELVELRRPNVVASDTGFGRTLGYVGDLNQDGYADVLAGEPSFDGATQQDAGQLRLVSIVAVPELDEIVGLHSTLSGEIILKGTSLSSNTIVLIDGSPQPLVAISPFEARLPVGPDLPGGFHDLSLTTDLGTLEVPNGLVRYPALGAEPSVKLGGQLAVEFENGSPGFYVLAFSGAAYEVPASFENFGWFHGLELNGVWTASTGALFPGDTARSFVLNAPTAPISIGADFYLQAWTFQSDLDLAGFSNRLTVTITP
ncbi:MAG: VCBS repeat-containing protein [Planctomycetota bacterium]|nr:VCBS repeat-containing protein [Planctomycetota bacterium]